MLYTKVYEEYILNSDKVAKQDMFEHFLLRWYLNNQDKDGANRKSTDRVRGDHNTISSLVSRLTMGDGDDSSDMTFESVRAETDNGLPVEGLLAIRRGLPGMDRLCVADMSRNCCMYVEEDGSIRGWTGNGKKSRSVLVHPLVPSFMECKCFEFLMKNVAARSARGSTDPEAVYKQLVSTLKEYNINYTLLL